MKVKSFPAAGTFSPAGLTGTAASPASNCSSKAQSENKYPWCTCPRGGQAVPHEAFLPMHPCPYGIYHDLHEPSFRPRQVASREAFSRCFLHLPYLQKPEIFSQLFGRLRPAAAKFYSVMRYDRIKFRRHM